MIKEEINSITSCEKEPIHIPESIQPFGVLLGMPEETFLIEHVSENANAEFGFSKDLLGTSFLKLLTKKSRSQLEQILNDKIIQNPYRFKIGSKSWEGFFHRQGGVLLLELFEISSSARNYRELMTQTNFSISLLQKTKSVHDLCKTLANQVHKISGYDRVMIYRFDEAWNGEVIAEARSNDCQTTYLGHHFPASDIPAQARAIFLTNWIRMIPNTSYVPCPIRSLNKEGKPLDLGRSFLRSVSPIHIQYLNNMDSQATFTMSLLHEGRLWGLVACHHGSPRVLPTQARSSCKLLSKLVSSQITIKEREENAEYKHRLLEVNKKLLEFMRNEEDLDTALIMFSPNLLDLVGAKGAAAAIKTEGSWKLVGVTPNTEEIDGLVDWLVKHHSEHSIFHTDRLPELYPAALQFKDKASGLLSVSIPKSARSFVLWFRPEVIQSVVWAGNPTKQVERLPDGTLKIEPRLSFESWKEILKNRSSPWMTVEIEAASELQHSILEIDLQRQFTKEMKARQVAEKFVLEKEAILSTVSHDLKNPLSSIALTLKVLEKKLEKVAAKKLNVDDFIEDLKVSLQRVSSATHRMERLIYDLLDIAKMESGNFVLDTAPCNVGGLVREAVALFEPIAQEKQITLTAPGAEKAVTIQGDEDRLIQALSNLLGNALKFTPPLGAVSISCRVIENQLRIEVQDSGSGIASEDLPKIFDRFWQARKTQRSGSGLGLAITQGIISAHGGSISVRSTVGQGTCFRITLPLKS